MTTPAAKSSSSKGMILKALFYGTLTTIFVLALIPEPEQLPEVTKISDKLNHIVAFAVLGLLIDIAFAQRNLQWKVSFLLVYGLAIECAQYFVPSREFSLLDLAVDALGIAAYCAGKTLLAKLSCHHVRR